MPPPRRSCPMTGSDGPCGRLSSPEDRTMRRWARFVLTHRRWVVLFWLLVMVGGAVAAGQVSKRLTVEFSLPGQPGTRTAQQIPPAAFQAKKRHQGMCVIPAIHAPKTRRTATKRCSYLAVGTKTCASCAMPLASALSLAAIP